MHRNLDRRVETLVRIADPDHVAELVELIDVSMDDGTASWHLEPDGTWVRHHLGADGTRSRDLQERASIAPAAPPAAARAGDAQPRRCAGRCRRRAGRRASSASGRGGGALVWRERDGASRSRSCTGPATTTGPGPRASSTPASRCPPRPPARWPRRPGTHVVLGVPLPGPASTALSDGRGKRVHYWAARVAGRPDAAALRRPRCRSSRASPKEIDAAALARRGRRRPSDADPRRRPRAARRAASSAARQGPPRHATRSSSRGTGTARQRSAWKGDEHDRPLTPSGRAQAEALVPVLAAFGVARGRHQPRGSAAPRPSSRTPGRRARAAERAPYSPRRSTSAPRPGSPAASWRCWSRPARRRRCARTARCCRPCSTCWRSTRAAPSPTRCRPRTRSCAPARCSSRTSRRPRRGRAWSPSRSTGPVRPDHAGLSRRQRRPQVRIGLRIQ